MDYPLGSCAGVRGSGVDGGGIRHGRGVGGPRVRAGTLARPLKGEGSHVSHLSPPNGAQIL